MGSCCELLIRHPIEGLSFIRMIRMGLAVRLGTLVRRLLMETPMSSLPERNVAVVVCGNHSTAEAAVRELRRSGFDLGKVSVAGRDSSKPGAFWAGTWGMLSDWDFFAISDIGLVFVAGPLAEWVAAGSENAALFGGLSALGAGLYSIGIPKSSVLEYEAALKDNRCLVVAHGTADEVNRAREILQRAGGAGSAAA